MDKSPTQIVQVYPFRHALHSNGALEQSVEFGGDVPFGCARVQQNGIRGVKFQNCKRVKLEGKLWLAVQTKDE